jgi:hypothetical protein
MEPYGISAGRQLYLDICTQFLDMYEVERAPSFRFYLRVDRKLSVVPLSVRESVCVSIRL